MTPGTIIKLPDGQEATIVYHGLDGYGIVFGRQKVDVQAIYDCAPIFKNGNRNPECPEPEAMLRKPWKGSELPCVGDDYEIVEPFVFGVSQ